MTFLMRSATSCCAVLICASFLSAQDGVTLYKQHCAACHDQISPRIPPRSALQKLSASRILRTLDFGVMMGIAYPLRRQEREAIANFLGTPGQDAPFPASAFCSERGPSLSTPSPNWIGWSPTSSNTRFQSPRDAGLSAAQIPNLKLKWAFGFRGDIIAFGALTIRSGTLFTGSASGTIYAMNAKTGCLYWTFQANGPVRSAPLIAENEAGYSVLFGDQTGWFHALDATTGKLLWMVLCLCPPLRGKRLARFLPTTLVVPFAGVSLPSVAQMVRRFGRLTWLIRLERRASPQRASRPSDLLVPQCGLPQRWTKSGGRCT
jgi:putative pyrroloquinoline-quinone binding quinoprotein